MNILKRFPVATWLTVGTVLLGALTALQAAGVLTGRVAAWVSAAVVVLNLILGVRVHAAVTPLSRPRDAIGRPLTPKDIP